MTRTLMIIRLAGLCVLMALFTTNARGEDGLTGTWRDNGGSKYLVRQVGSDVFWMVDARPKVINTFHGTLSGNTITGRWADLPEGRIQGSGTLVLRVENSNRMVKVSGSYGASTWTRGCAAAWQMDLAPCSPDICGGYPANQGMYAPGVGRGKVTVCTNGQVQVSLPELVNRQTGQRLGSKAFEINYGTFGNQQWSGSAIGGFTTDAAGRFEGSSGTSVVLPVTKAFVLNSDGRSQFITVPPFHPQPAYPAR